MGESRAPSRPEPAGRALDLAGAAVSFELFPLQSLPGVGGAAQQGVRGIVAQWGWGAARPPLSKHRGRMRSLDSGTGGLGRSQVSRGVCAPNVRRGSKEPRRGLWGSLRMATEGERSPRPPHLAGLPVYWFTRRVPPPKPDPATAPAGPGDTPRPQVLGWGRAPRL